MSGLDTTLLKSWIIRSPLLSGVKLNKLNTFERKVYRRILGPVYYNEKENWKILTNKETYARVRKPTIIETIHGGETGGKETTGET